MDAWENIPGETPIDDISGLIPKEITTRSQLNVVEAENIRKTVLRYLAAKPTRRQAPFTLDWCYKLHRQMFGDVWRWAGRKRSVEVNIGVPVHRIDVDLHMLMEDLAYWHDEGEMDPIEQSARLHHRAVQIHPFLNGNGRWSRLLANIHLKRMDHPLTVWPEQTVGDSSIIRGEYLTAVRAADGGDLDALIALHRRFTSR
jgi:Fic-DOC domain mobile mystery protein B